LNKKLYEGVDQMRTHAPRCRQDVSAFFCSARKLRRHRVGRLAWPLGSDCMPHARAQRYSAGNRINRHRLEREAEFVVLLPLGRNSSAT